MARYSKTIWNTSTYYNPTNMNHIEQGIYDADLREGGTIGGSLNIVNKGTSSTVGNSTLVLGNNIAEGSADNSRGRIGIFSNNTRYAYLYASDDMSANRNIYLPDKAGTIALTSDIEWTSKGRLSITTTETEFVFGADTPISLLVIGRIL